MEKLNLNLTVRKTHKTLLYDEIDKADYDQPVLKVSTEGEGWKWIQILNAAPEIFALLVELVRAVKGFRIREIFRLVSRALDLINELAPEVAERK